MNGLILTTLLLAAIATPPPSYVEKLLVQVENNMEPDRASTRKLAIDVSGSTGGQSEPVHWTARQARKTLKDGRRTLTVFFAPEALKGFALLRWDRNDQSSMEWAYLAPLKRLRKDFDFAGTSFLYTELTFADLGPLRFGDRTLTLLGAEQRGGKRCYKVREIPREPGPYARVITWIAAESLVLVEREFYDSTELLVKTQHFEDYLPVEGGSIPQRMAAEDKVNGGITDVHIGEVRFDVDIPDTVFDPSKLFEVVAHPFWQSLGQ